MKINTDNILQNVGAMPHSILPRTRFKLNEF